MSFLRAPNTKPEFTSLQIQTSVSTLPIPIIWGTTKASGNVLFYANFKTSGGSTGKGGIFGQGNATQTYSADVIIGLCEGIIGGIGTIWRDQSTYTLADLGLLLFEGSTPQSVWSYLATNYPTQALGYQGTAYLCAASYQLGSNAEIGNHNFEIKGFFASTGGNGIDADPALCVYDFLTSAQYGAGFNAASIDMTTLEGSGGDASLQTYCKAQGISFSPCLTTQEQASSVLTRWLQILNCAAVWSQGQLKFIPYGDQTINSGNVTTTVQVAIPQPTTTLTTPNATPSVIVCESSLFISDGGVKYATSGTAFTYGGTGNPTTAGTYGLNPNGDYLFALADAGEAVAITYTYSIPVSYVPYLTPIYALNDLDFLTDGGNKDPVTCSRVDPFSLPNILRVECLSRNNQYAGTPVEARDQSQIELYGPRVGSTITAHEICDDVVIGPIVAQAVLQRQLYVRAKFQFKLSLEYCLLDPMDIVQITDANLGLSAYPVRIVSIEEDEKGNLAIEAEELTVGISAPALYNASGRSGYIGNHSKPADSINTPLIYEPPTALTGGVAQVWVGASGGSGGVADPNWGGAYVWVSIDNVTYSDSPIATISEPVKQGVLTASIAAASGWDTTHTLAVNLTESGATVGGTTAVNAQSGGTLALVDSELLAYETATLTSAYHYNLTNLQRGLYGTTGASHSSSAAFTRLNGAIVKYNLPQQYIGIDLYFKFQSFNVFGGGVEALSACTAYTYSPSGAGFPDPIMQQLLAGFAVDLGSVATAASVTDDFGVTGGGVLNIADLGLA